MVIMNYGLEDVLDIILQIDIVIVHTRLIETLFIYIVKIYKNGLKCNIMKEVLEAMKQYLETTPLEEVVRTWMKYNTPENNVGVTMEEFLDDNSISPLEVLETMRTMEKIDFKHITIDEYGIYTWTHKPIWSSFQNIYEDNNFVDEKIYLVHNSIYESKTIDWKGQTIYSLD